MKEVEQLKNVINTLNLIEVHGKNNLDMLLGSIMVLQKLAVEMSKTPTETTKE